MNRLLILCLLLVSSTCALRTCNSNRDCGIFDICVPTGIQGSYCVGIDQLVNNAPEPSPDNSATANRPVNFPIINSECIDDYDVLD